MFLFGHINKINTSAYTICQILQFEELIGEHTQTCRHNHLQEKSQKLATNMIYNLLCKIQYNILFLTNLQLRLSLLILLP